MNRDIDGSDFEDGYNLGRHDGLIEGRAEGRAEGYAAGLRDPERDGYLWQAGWDAAIKSVSGDAT